MFNLTVAILLKATRRFPSHATRATGRVLRDATCCRNTANGCAHGWREHAAATAAAPTAAAANAARAADVSRATNAALNDAACWVPGNTAAAATAAWGRIPAAAATAAAAADGSHVANAALGDAYGHAATNCDDGATGSSSSCIPGPFHAAATSRSTGRANSRAACTAGGTSDNFAKSSSAGKGHAACLLTATAFAPQPPVSGAQTLQKCFGL